MKQDPYAVIAFMKCNDRVYFFRQQIFSKQDATVQKNVIFIYTAQVRGNIVKKRLMKLDKMPNIAF